MTLQAIMAGKINLFQNNYKISLRISKSFNDFKYYQLKPQKSYKIQPYRYNGYQPELFNSGSCPIFKLQQEVNTLCLKTGSKLLQTETINLTQFIINFTLFTCFSCAGIGSFLLFSKSSLLPTHTPLLRLHSADGKGKSSRTKD